jgi:hypothetical protein
VHKRKTCIFACLSPPCPAEVQDGLFVRGMGRRHQAEPGVTPRAIRRTGSTSLTIARIQGWGLIPGWRLTSRQISSFFSFFPVYGQIPAICKNKFPGVVGKGSSCHNQSFLLETSLGGSCSLILLPTRFFYAPAQCMPLQGQKMLRVQSLS